jgi:putative peptidoglycan lipid II flippase
LTEKAQILKSTSVITLATLTSRILGYIRDQRVAQLLGTTLSSDAFYLAFRIPNLLRRLVAEGAMSAAFVPVFTTYLVEKSEKEVWQFANRLFWTLAVMVTAIVALGMVFSPALIHAFTLMGHNTAELNEAAYLNRIIFPFILFISLSALSMAILNCFHVFGLPALTPAISNLGIILFSTALVWRQFHSPAAALAVGVVFGGALQFLAQLPQLRRHGMKFDWGISFSDPGIQRVGKLMVPMVFGFGVAHLNFYVDTIFATASKMPNGSVTALYYADRVMELVLGSYAVAVATAILPRMSRQAAARDFSTLKQTFSFSVRIVCFITIPAMIGMMMLSQPIVRVLFQHGKFVAESTRLTAWALIFYALALPAIAVAKLIVQAFYATKDTKTPVWVAAFVLGLNIALNSMFLFLFFPQLRNAGPALATAVSAYVNFVSLFIIFRKRYGRMGAREILFSVTKAFAASALMSGVCLLALRYGNLGHRSLPLDAAMLFATIAASFAVYLGLSWLLRAPEIREVYEFILWRKGTGAAAGLA